MEERKKPRIDDPHAGPKPMSPDRQAQFRRLLGSPDGSHSMALNRPPSQATADGNKSYQPISSLNNFTQQWRIKVRCVVKPEPKEYVTKKGPNAGQPSKLASVDLLDEWGGEIRAVMFGDLVDRYYPLLQQGKTYYIAKGEIRPADPRFNPKNQYEMRLTPLSEIQEAPESGPAIQRMKFSLLPSLGKIEECPVNASVDIIGVVKEVGQPSSILTKVKREQMSKRNIVVIDASLKQIEVTFWREMADRANYQVGDVLAMKNLRVGDFQGRSLSTGLSTYIEVNPEYLPQYRPLRDWYDGLVRSGETPTFERVGAGMASGNGGTSRPAPRKSLVEIKEAPISDPKGDYYVVQGALTFIKRENFAYPACATCTKKVFESGGTYTCEHCQKTLDSASVSHRYIVSGSLGDHTGTVFVGAFNEVAEQMFGMSAADLIGLKDQNAAAFEEKFAQVLFKPALFKVRAKVDERGDDHRVRYNIVSTPTFSFTEDAAAKLQEIKQYMQLYPS